MTKRLKNNEVVRTVWRSGRASSTRIVKQFDSMEEAFQTCREMNRPIFAEVEGKTWKLFPSGSVKQLLSNDSGHITLPGLLPFGLVVGLVWFFIHLAQTGLLNFVAGR